MYGLTPADLDLQQRARAFTDELITFEQTAEEHDGALPAEVAAAHHERAPSSSASTPPTCPTSVGGPGCSSLQQVLVQEQAGRVTNGIGWCLAHAPVLVGRRRQRPPARDAGCCRRSAVSCPSATRSPRRAPAPTCPT